MKLPFSNSKKSEQEQEEPQVYAPAGYSTDLHWRMPASAARNLSKQAASKTATEIKRHSRTLWNWKAHKGAIKKFTEANTANQNAYATYRSETDKSRKNSITYVLVIFALIAVLSLASIVKMFDLTVIKHKEYVGKAADQRLQRSVSYPERGNIYDRNGTLLALTTYVYNIGISPSALRSYLIDRAPKRSEIAEQVGKILEIDNSKMQEIIKQTDKPYIQLKRNVAAEVKNKLQEYLTQENIYGIVVDPVMTRYYPQNEYLSQVIGFTSKQDDMIEGVTGIERQYNAELSGQKGVSYKEVDNFNRQPLNNSLNLDINPQKSDDVYLTINKNIQEEAQRQIDALTNITEPRLGAFALIAKPDTGEILAMAQSQTFNLNKPYEKPHLNDLRIKYLIKDIEDRKKREEKARRKREYDETWAKIRGETLPTTAETTLDPTEIKKRADIERSITGEFDPFKNEQDMAYLTGEVWSNFCVQKSYEPGSIFKPFTLAIALQRNAVDLEKDYFSDSPLWVEGWTAYPIKCWSENMFGVNHGTELISQALWYSCNPPFSRLAERIGLDPFFEYVVKLGFYDKTGVDLPGEGVGVQHALNSLDMADLATLAFGEQATATPMQIMNAYIALANGGNMMEPHIVSKITDTNGNIKREIRPKNVRRVFSPEISRKVVELMRGTTHDGYPGQYIYSTGLDLAGKTGTSTVDVDGDGKDDLSCFSTVVIGSASNPEYIILIATLQPLDNNSYGTWAVQTAARRLALITHNELHKKAEFTDYDYSNAWRKHIVLNYKGLTLQHAYMDATEVRGLELVWPIGTDPLDEPITEQWPAPDARMIDDGKVFVGTAKHPLSSLNIQGNTDVPDFTGLNIVQAKALAKAAHINICIDGVDPKGVVISQDVSRYNEAGVVNQIRKWAVVRLRFTAKPYDPEVDDVVSTFKQAQVRPTQNKSDASPPAGTATEKKTSKTAGQQPPVKGTKKH